MAIGLGHHNEDIARLLRIDHSNVYLFNDRLEEDLSVDLDIIHRKRFRKQMSIDREILQLRKAVRTNRGSSGRRDAGSGRTSSRGTIAANRNDLHNGTAHHHKDHLRHKSVEKTSTCVNKTKDNKTSSNNIRKSPSKNVTKDIPSRAAITSGSSTFLTETGEADEVDSFNKDHNVSFKTPYESSKTNNQIKNQAPGRPLTRFQAPRFMSLCITAEADEDDGSSDNSSSSDSESENDSSSYSDTDSSSDSTDSETEGASKDRTKQRRTKNVRGSKGKSGKEGKDASGGNNIQRKQSVQVKATVDVKERPSDLKTNLAILNLEEAPPLWFTSVLEPGGSSIGHRQTTNNYPRPWTAGMDKAAAAAINTKRLLGCKSAGRSAFHNSPWGSKMVRPVTAPEVGGANSLQKTVRGKIEKTKEQNKATKMAQSGAESYKQKEEKTIKHKSKHHKARHDQENGEPVFIESSQINVKTSLSEPTTNLTLGKSRRELREELQEEQREIEASEDVVSISLQERYTAALAEQAGIEVKVKEFVRTLEEEARRLSCRGKKDILEAIVAETCPA